MRRPDCTLVTVDHNVPTTDRSAFKNVETFIKEVRRGGGSMLPAPCSMLPAPGEARGEGATQWRRLRTAAQETGRGGKRDVLCTLLGVTLMSIKEGGGEAAQAMSAMIL